MFLYGCIYANKISVGTQLAFLAQGGDLLVPWVSPPSVWFLHFPLSPSTHITGFLWGCLLLSRLLQVTPGQVTIVASHRGWGDTSLGVQVALPRGW